MGLFKSLKGDLPSQIGGSDHGASSSSSQQYQPPSGPPPSSQNKEKHQYVSSGAGAYDANADWTAQQPPPYHDWQAVEDTALLPPPPALANKYSPSGNADEEDAIRAHQWCDANPLIAPHEPLPAQVAAVEQGRIELQQPREYVGSLTSREPGYWIGSSKDKCPDSAILSSMPLYFEVAHSPYRTEKSKTIYYEVKIHSFGARGRQGDASMALGFCAVPYPTWRLPGWERGSLAVHSDDGRRYVNDTDGGVDFTPPFQPGETIGIGLTFSVPDRPQDFAPDPVRGRPLAGRVFLTRNGVAAGGWDLGEQQDADNDLGAYGVDGSHDLFAVIGVYGKAEFEVVFQSHRWLSQP